MIDNSLDDVVVVVVVDSTTAVDEKFTEGLLNERIKSKYFSLPFI
jgi:hypothetical protein